MITAIFQPENWALVPFHFWTGVFFIFGAMVGSFLNVCIHRMPLELSVVSPSSHCPHCRYSIPWFLNLPLITWLWLRGRCANCRAPISIRYFLVELLTGALFAAAWIVFGPQSAWLALAYCLLLAGFIVATFIDFAHFIIPDEITIGGMVAGFICSAAVPALHPDWLTNAVPTHAVAIKRSLIGMAVGGGVIYAILRLGKLAFGRQRFELPASSVVTFTETALLLPDGELPYEEVFYRKSDTIILQAERIEMVDRCFRDVELRLTPQSLRIGGETFDPTSVPCLEVVTSEIIVPREAMGLGDVKFMAAIGAFLGWQATLFSLMVSAVIGSVVGVVPIIFGKQEWSSRLPYGPYIALAAVIWIFGGRHLAAWWFR